MANYFDGPPLTAFQGLVGYVNAHTSEETLAEVRASSADPNDLLAFADAVRMYAPEKARSHARILYAQGIERLEANPQRQAANINLAAARRNLCLCFMPDAPLEAFAALTGGPGVIAADPALAACVGAVLVEEKHFDELAVILAEIAKIAEPDLAAKLEAHQMSLELVDSLHTRLRTHLGKRKMCDLQWLTASETDRIPSALMELEIDALLPHGIPVDLLATIQSAVVLRSTPDRKRWDCGFFDLEDPRPLLAKGVIGLFRVEFQNQVDESGADGVVEITAVQHK